MEFKKGLSNKWNKFRCDEIQASILKLKIKSIEVDKKRNKIAKKSII